MTDTTAAEDVIFPRNVRLSEDGDAVVIIDQTQLRRRERSYS